MNPEEIETRLAGLQSQADETDRNVIGLAIGLLLVMALVLVALLWSTAVQGAEAADTGARGWRRSSPNRPLVRPDPASAAPILPRLLAAIRAVESSGGRDTRDGDDGAAIGPYQIHRDYWADSGVPGRWEDCRREPYARRVVLAYMRRYEPGALARVDAEILARLHNGGPSWRQRPATAAYWRKVRAAMDAG